MHCSQDFLPVYERVSDYLHNMSGAQAIPFYERLGFIRVGTVARARDLEEMPEVRARGWFVHSIGSAEGTRVR